MKRLDPSTLRTDPLLHRVWEQLGRPLGCRVTGGYVRDRLLGRPSNDLDLTIEGNAEEAGVPARKLARALGVRPHLFGSAPHRIWRIEAPLIKVELWPLGELTADEDIRRRDFACNALSWELPAGPLVDLVGGVDDLEGSRLRAISRANLEDDPVRLLRGPRFLAQLEGFSLDERTSGWIQELAPMVTGAPRERVGQELLTMLRGPMASRGLAKCVGLDLLHPASPAGNVDTRWLELNIDAADTLAVHHTEDERHCGAGVPPAISRRPDGTDAVRLAFLFLAWGIPADSELRPYAWPKSDRENALRAAGLFEEARSTSDSSATDRREFAWRAGSAFPTLISLGAALEPDKSGWTRWWHQWLRNPAAFRDPQPLLTGMEIASIAGIDPGPKLGRLAQRLLRAQVRREVRTLSGARRWLTGQAGSRGGNQER